MISLAHDDIERFFEAQLTSEQADDLLVISTTSAMALALKEERDLRGKCGWHTSSQTNGEILDRLVNNLQESWDLKSLTDVIVLAAMLRLRLEIYGAKGELPKPREGG